MADVQPLEPFKENTFRDVACDLQAYEVCPERGFPVLCAGQRGMQGKSGIEVNGQMAADACCRSDGIEEAFAHVRTIGFGGCPGMHARHEGKPHEEG